MSPESPTEELENLKEQQKLSAEALVFAESIIATIRQPFLVLDDKLRVKMANNSFYRVFQVSKDDTEGRFIYFLGNGQWDIPLLRTQLDEVLPQNHSFENFDVEHNFPMIGKKHMLLNANCFPPMSNRPQCILLAIEDITERRLAEIAMGNSENRYRRLFQTAKDGILILDAATLKIIDANPFMMDLLEYTYDEFMGKELWQIGLFSDKMASQKAYRELQEKGYIRYDHLPLKTKNGKQVEVEFVSNIYQADQRLVAQCNIRDITERSRLEREMIVQAMKLEVALQQADILNKRKDEFLAILGHELRNPLAAMSNAVAILKLGTGQKGATAAVDIMNNQCEHINMLVDDIITVTRAIGGKIEIKREKVLISDVIERSIQIAEPLIHKMKHQMIVDKSVTEGIAVIGDKIRPIQVVSNLLTNAAKYTAEGGIIELKSSRQNGHILIVVRDNGIGIEDKDLNAIFDLCVRTDRARNKENGLGVGLTTVRAIVELHGGTIVASSQGPDLGSTFTLRLPVA